MPRSYTFVVPVYNRPDEIRLLLESICNQVDAPIYDLIVVEDGSKHTSKEVCEFYRQRLPLLYFQKPNTGPGDSRNYGSVRATGDYILYVDSDCILPPSYLAAVDAFLEAHPVACFGGRDAAMSTFSKFQKGVNHVMTSFFTTGGIRGSKRAVGKFQPRSFNMGISKTAFEQTKGFRNIHPGEDPDLAIRIQQLGLETAYADSVFVYHKRRTSWKAFFVQVYKFGLSRAVLNHWHPNSSKWVYWLPSVFLMAFVLSLALSLFSATGLLSLFLVYWSIVFLESLVRNRCFAVAFFSLSLSVIQMFGYGYGFLKGSAILALSKEKRAEKHFPLLFWPKK